MAGQDQPVLSSMLAYTELPGLLPNGFVRSSDVASGGPSRLRAAKEVLSRRWTVHTAIWRLLPGLRRGRSSDSEYIHTTQVRAFLRLRSCSCNGSAYNRGGFGSHSMQAALLRLTLS